jgi:succinate dehydrogenase/fumarate reductase flavoprotein subunit
MLKGGFLMISEVVSESDVLVIGGGLSGIFAAIKAREEGASVTLVDKAYIGRTGAAMLASFFSVFNPDWGHNLSQWKHQISELGEYMNNPEATEISLKESYDRYQDLVSWGAKFRQGSDGSPLRMTGQPRTGRIFESCYFGGGWRFLPLMRNQALKMGITIVDTIMITDLMKEEGKVIGAVGFHAGNGNFYIFHAKATVLCAGGGNFGASTHIGRRSTHDGEAIAYRAGAYISGSEFSSHLYPVMESEIEGHISLRGREIKLAPEGMRHAPLGCSIDTDGKIVTLVTLSSMVTSIAAGRGPILCDLDAEIPEVYKNTMQLLGSPDDPLAFLDGKPDQVQGGLYLGTMTYTEGTLEGGGKGIWSANTDGATSVTGLYAAGDCYNSGAVGAVYPSVGFGTRGAAVTGARAGRGAAVYAVKAKIINNRAEVDRLKSITYAPLERMGGFDAEWVTQQTAHTMVPFYISLVKHGDRLKAALTILEYLNKQIGPMMYCRPKDAHGLRLVHEARSRALMAEVILRSALFRTESRGSHYREDYPRRDDPSWLAQVKVRENDGKMELIKEPLPKKWWPDLLIPYRKRYPWRFLNENVD